MKWDIQPEWKGEDAIIIGGGSSLRCFDFQRIRGKNTIGCNDAFNLGADIVKICVFGDASFFQREKWCLEKFKGRILTVAPSLMNIKLDWLLRVNRERDGLHTGDKLGWNHSTGALAINLALSLGATRVFLLGFDLSVAGDGRHHWHNYNPKPGNAEVYRRFLKGFQKIWQALPLTFPHTEVLNVTNGSSQLPYFPRITFDQFLTHVSSQAQQEFHFQSRVSQERPREVA